MKIIVLAGGLSTERDVSLSSAAGICRTLLEKGHDAFLLDVFMGLEHAPENLEDVFTLPDHGLDIVKNISTEEPDLAAVKASRPDQSDCFFGPNVIELCRLADITFLGLHGGEGENGKLQAAFDLLGIKYTGPDSLGCAVAMHKGVAKQIFLESGVDTPGGGTLYKNGSDLSYQSLGLTLPVVVKPCSGGSSIGVYIVNTDEEYQNAIAEEIVLSPPEAEKYDSVETYVYYCATRSLMKAAGFNFRYEFIDEDDETAYKELYDDWYSRYQRTLFTGGYRIYTAIDMDKQQLLMDSLDAALAWNTETNDEGVYKLQASAVCIDNASGYVTAIVGGRNQGLPGYTLNRAYQSFRQPGSAIKPLVVYAPYLGLGHNPDELIDDSPMEGGPENFENRYPGEETLQEALAWSSNVAAWKLFEQITPEYGMSFVKKMHFRKIGDDEHYMAACLGGWSYGASALEMAGAYAALAGDGVFHEPTAVMRITDSKGRTIVDNGGNGTQIYEKNAARMVSKMLQYGVEHGIATGAKLDNAVAAVKTGTTTDNKDGWTVGYSAYYTTAVWVGYDIPKRMADLTGGTYPMTIWKSFMQAVHEGLEIKEFPEYTEYADNSVKTDTLPDNIIDNGDNSRQESTAAIEDIQNALGDKSYNGAGGDGNAESSAGGDGNATGMVSGDGNVSGHPGGDDNASGTVGGDKNAGVLGGDGNASGSVGGDKKAGTVGGDTNAPGNSRGDSDAAGTAGGDASAGAGTFAGGDTNAGYTAGDDTSAGAGTSSGDTNAGYMVGGDTDVKLP